MNKDYAYIASYRAEHNKNRVTFVSGNFNLLHAGHIRLLRFAKELGDMLVVGVLPQSESNVSFSEEDRLESIQALSVVDYAFILEDAVCDVLQALKPDFVVKGKEFESLYNIEESALAHYGGRLIFSAGEARPSEIDKIIKTELQAPTLLVPEDFCKRHQICSNKLQDTLKKFDGLRVCVVGDVIIDEYITCDALGMSQEDPTLVVTPVETKKFLGGAGIVAAHASGLGAKVHFFTICGEDSAAEFTKEKLKEYGVEPYLFTDTSRPTTYKQRFRCMDKTLLRVSHLRQHAISQDLGYTFSKSIESILSEIDVLIFSDFNYGCLPQYVVNRICKAATAHGVMYVADSQASSQMSDVSRFVGASLLTPTEREARLALQDFESGLVVLAQKLQKKTGAKHVVTTLGSSGILIQTEKIDGTDRLPALNVLPKDVAGAGDSLLTTATLCLATGADIWHSVYLASLAAAVQVSREGNVPLKRLDLLRHGLVGC